MQDGATGAPQARAAIDAADLADYLATHRLTATGGQLAIPGHAPLFWRKEKLRFLRSRHKRRAFYEEVATLTVSFLLNKLRPKTVFDIGAASGYFARVAASHLEAAPSVHAFEMRPFSLDAMRAAIERDGLNGRVFPHPTALSDRHEGNRDVWFCGTKLYETEPAPSEWQPPLWHRIKLALNGEIRTLRKASLTLTTLDRFVADHGIVPELLKIDVDGYEGKVLRGGRNTLATHRPAIALELHKNKLIRDDTRKSVMATLLGSGYRAYFLTDHHDRKACRVVPVADADHPLLARQETDFIVLF